MYIMDNGNTRLKYTTLMFLFSSESRNDRNYFHIKICTTYIPADNENISVYVKIKLINVIVTTLHPVMSGIVKQPAVYVIRL